MMRWDEATDMTDAIRTPCDADDIIDRIMAEMEDALRLIEAPSGAQRDQRPMPVSNPDARKTLPQADRG